MARTRSTEAGAFRLAVYPQGKPFDVIASGNGAALAAVKARQASMTVAMSVFMISSLRADQFERLLRHFAVR